MNSDFLIWLDVLGFEELARLISETSGRNARKVRQDFVQVIDEKVKELERRGYVKGKNYGGADDWLLVVNSLDAVFEVVCEILDHNTEYKGFEKIPLEIAVGRGHYDKWAKLNSSSLISEGSTIEFLKNPVVDYYREWYRAKYQSQVTSTFLILTEEVYREMNPFEKEFCEKAEYSKSIGGKKIEVSFFVTQLPKVIQRGLVFQFLWKIGKSPSSSFRRIERIFIPPNEYESILFSLEKNKFVFIIGDPEIGKTYTAARILWEYFLKGYTPVWHPGAEPQERADVRKKISECQISAHSITYFEDPFGKIKFEDREDLRRTIDCVISKIQSSDSRVIITSREEVFKEFEKEKLSQSDLRKFAVDMRLMKPSYDSKKMEQMLFDWGTEFDCDWLKIEDLKSLVVREASRRLVTPLSLWDFALTSRRATNAVEIMNMIEEKSKSVSASFAEEIAQMSREEILFLSLLAILNRLKPEIIKVVYARIFEELNLDLHDGSFETLESQFYPKIGKEEIYGPEGRDYYYKFTHPSYEEAIVTSWNRKEIIGLVLKLLSALIKDDNPLVRGWFGLFLTKNLAEFSFKSQALGLITAIAHDRNVTTRYGVAEAVKRSFLRIPVGDRLSFLELLLKDRHREVRAASINTVSRNFVLIPKEQSLVIIQRGLEDRAAYVRLEAVDCVRFIIDVLPESVVFKAWSVLNELLHYSGWWISYSASLTYWDFKQKFEQRIGRKLDKDGKV